jgi:hypothetical protein
MLQELGDVIEIDGTHVPLKTKWENVPITVMDSGLHIQYGGVHVRRRRHSGRLSHGFWVCFMGNLAVIV